MTESADAQTLSRITVLFIAGAGRSGSTILDNVLGQVEGLVSVGELRYVWERGLVENRLCGCGSHFRECPFWRAVLTDAFGSIEGADPDRMRMLQGRGVRARYLPVMLGPQRVRESLVARLGEYPDALQKLYRSVIRKSKSRVVVDSSKLPAYGFVLGMLPSIDLRVVHLIRDPRATAFSWLRKKRQPDKGAGAYMERQGPVKSSVLWSVWNAAAGLLWGGRPERYLRIRYEDFVARPQDAIRKILALVGEHPEHLPFESESSVRLAANHTVAGNPSRFERGTVEIRPDVEWKSKMSRRDRAAVMAITWPLLRRYGYPFGS
jgi:hypothetical protein